MNLDNPDKVLGSLRMMQGLGSKAFDEATEGNGLTGSVRNMLYGINTTIDALVDMIEEENG